MILKLLLSPLLTSFSVCSSDNVVYNYYYSLWTTVSSISTSGHNHSNDHPSPPTSKLMLRLAVPSQMVCNSLCAIETVQYLPCLRVELLLYLAWASYYPTNSIGKSLGFDNHIVMKKKTKKHDNKWYRSWGQNTLQDLPRSMCKSEHFHL